MGGARRDHHGLAATPAIKLPYSHDTLSYQRVANDPGETSCLVWDCKKQVKQAGLDRSAFFATGVEDADFAGRLAAVIMRAMNWLTNYVLPKIRAFAKKDVPDNLWKKCPGCEQMLFHRELADHLEVCHHCGHHFRIGSEARFKIVFDGGVFEKLEPPKVMPDPLRFRDRKRYSERLREGQPVAWLRVH